MESILSERDRPADIESTATLLGRVRAGDLRARDDLARRYLPMLQAWASGRLPGWARGPADTDDLVQVTLLRALDRVNEFEPRREGAFLAYLRQTLTNRIRDLLRQAGRRPQEELLDGQVPDPGPSPLQTVIGVDTMMHYDEALEQLTPEQREAVVLRVEFGMTYPEVAEAMGLDSWNAARMRVVRGLLRLAELMEVRRGG